MNPTELYAHLTRACTRGYSALRAVTPLQPVGSTGDAIFPPTYLNEKNEPSYAWFDRQNGDKAEKAVILDSVQSQANRFELALLAAHRNGELQMPLVQVAIEGHGVITALDAPHRVNDAIFRDSLVGNEEFGKSALGKALKEAREWNAAAFLEYAPNVLIFGTWDSQSGGGTNTAKVARALVSEIVGLGATATARTSSRIDPLGIQRSVQIFQNPDTKEWFSTEDDAKKAKVKKPKQVKPSEINHGNVAPTINNSTGGVTLREAIQTTVLSFTQLRKLHFGKSAEADVAARAVLASLAILAVELFWEDGFLLRSRCQLLPATRPEWQLIGATAGDSTALAFDLDTARETYRHAVAAARQAGFAWNTVPIVLTPSEKLKDLVRRSDASTATEESE